MNLRGETADNVESEMMDNLSTPNLKLVSPFQVTFWPGSVCSSFSLPDFCFVITSTFAFSFPETAGEAWIPPEGGPRCSTLYKQDEGLA